MVAARTQGRTSTPGPTVCQQNDLVWLRQVVLAFVVCVARACAGTHIRSSTSTCTGEIAASSTGAGASARTPSVGRTGCRRHKRIGFNHGTLGRV